MKKKSRQILTAFILFCMISIFGCGKEQITDKEEMQSEVTTDVPEQNEADNAPEQNGYANPMGNRITYADGYYYYASQLDNYFLYRAKEDGSDAECLAKVHSGSILVDGDVLYFVNLSEGKAIYRIGTDGSDMQKICDNSNNNIQMSAEYIYFLDSDDSLYRIRKDGSGKELLLKDAEIYMLAATNGEKVMYDGYLYCRRTQWNEEAEQIETIILRYDLNAENEEEICRFDFYGGSLIVCIDRIYCFGTWKSAGKIGEYIAWKKEVKYLPEKELTDCCVYNGALYGIVEDTDEDSRQVGVYKLEEGETQWEEIYRNDAECTFYADDFWKTSLTDIYATERGVFFRQFVSPEEGVKWFSLSDTDNAGKWEDENVIPIIKPASMMEKGRNWYSIKEGFQSTEGYEEYLGEDLTYEEYYRTDEKGEGHNPYRICLPQFNEKIEGYREINAYFQNAYQEALGYKQEFFDMLDENRTDDEEGPGFFDSDMAAANESTDYDYVYIGEKYITVAKYQEGYWYGGRGWQAEEPVTFERETGRVVTLEDFFGDTSEEAVARVTASVYKYMENGERSGGRKYFLKDKDTLTEEFLPEQFFLFPEGIGIYYRKYAIDSGAAGDCVFIVPYPERNEVTQQETEEDENGYANPQGNRIAYADGYFYYASQLDNYFLYRIKEDGSEAECLAKVHSGTILVDGDVLYFVNLSDDKAIYRIGTDGSDMKKICDNSDNNIQMSAEYIYFWDTYEHEADIRGLFSEAQELSWRSFLYRIRKDGSGKELLMGNVADCRIVAANGGKVMYDGYIYCDSNRKNKETGKWDTVVTRYDLDGENEEEICCFNIDGEILVFGSDLICCRDSHGNDGGRLGIYITWKKEMKYFPDEKVTDYCYYKGALYGIREDKDKNGRLTRVYRMKCDGETQWEEIYCNDVDCTSASGYYYRENLTDIYATEQGVFFRQFVSSEEGVKWFLLSEDGNAVKWEDESVIPITKQASMMKYTSDYISIKRKFQSTDGYEEYLGENLAYEEFYRTDEEGKSYNPYRICLPQFNEKIEGYREINAYFQNAYKEALKDKEEFFDMLDEESEKDENGFPKSTLCERTDYDYVYIGEEYITVAMYRHGYSGGKRSWNTESPVTFERKTGRVVTLEDFFGDAPGEAVARATASIYKYMENGDGYGAKFFLKDYDMLTAAFEPEQFFLFPEGIGIYYRRYAIDSGLDGDYVFIVPYPD